jgi:lipopolysaccharide biosynthesis glycosyltransferase
MLSIASIIDPTSWQKCLVKLHSILESTNHLSRLKFKFLLFNLSISTWESKLNCCFADKKILFESKVWSASPFLQKVLKRDHKFTKEHIFARFYLPKIFPDTDARRMLYLDNDMVVTTDVIDFLSTKMTSVGGNYKQLDSTQMNQIKEISIEGGEYQAPVSLVFEKAIFYQFYILSHFDTNHSYVKKAITAHGGYKYFCNSGVVLYDTHLWIEQNQTGVVEDLLQANSNQVNNGNRPIFDSVAGDQGVYYLLQNISYLEPRFNMRRHPVRSVNLMSHTTGIIHFAGVMGGLQNLCRYPFLIQYKHLLHHALPLYLSVVASIENKCYSVVHDSPTSSTVVNHDVVVEFCASSAVNRLLDELARRKNLSTSDINEVHFKPGIGNFTWPPPLLTMSNHSMRQLLSNGDSNRRIS